ASGQIEADVDEFGRTLRQPVNSPLALLLRRLGIDQEANLPRGASFDRKIVAPAVRRGAYPGFGFQPDLNQALDSNRAIDLMGCRPDVDMTSQIGREADDVQLDLFRFGHGGPPNGRRY